MNLASLVLLIVVDFFYIVWLAKNTNEFRLEIFLCAIECLLAIYFCYIIKTFNDQVQRKVRN